MKFPEFVYGALVLIAVGIVSLYLYRTSGMQHESNDTVSIAVPAVATKIDSVAIDKKVSDATSTPIAFRSDWRVQSTSPNGKYVAMLYSTEEETKVYLADAVTGKHLTQVHEGSVNGWTPDSTRAIVFVHDVYEDRKSKGRAMYYLDVNGTYENMGLPYHTSAAIVSITGTIVYSKAKNDGVDACDLFVREPGKEDRLLVAGENNIFIPLRFSVDQKSIIFKKMDLGGSPDRDNEWSVPVNGSLPPEHL